MTTSQARADVTAADQKAVQAVPGRIMAAWADQDGERFSEVFTEDGTMVLPGQDVRRGRAEIAAFMTAAFAGPFRGTQVTGTPVDVRFLSTDTAVVVTRGGIISAGEESLTPDRAVNATWVVCKRSDCWQLAAYHNSPAS